MNEVSAEERIIELEAKVERLTKVLHDSYMLLPLVPGSALAWGDSDLTPHVRAVADEWAIRERQLAAERAEVERLTLINKRLEAALVRQGEQYAAEAERLWKRIAAHEALSDALEEA